MWHLVAASAQAFHQAGNALVARVLGMARATGCRAAFQLVAGQQDVGGVLAEALVLRHQPRRAHATVHQRRAEPALQRLDAPTNATRDECHPTAARVSITPPCFNQDLNGAASRAGDSGKHAYHVANEDRAIERHRTHCHGCTTSSRPSRCNASGRKVHLGHEPAAEGVPGRGCVSGHCDCTDHRRAARKLPRFSPNKPVACAFVKHRLCFLLPVTTGFRDARGVGAWNGTRLSRPVPCVDQKTRIETGFAIGIIEFSTVLLPGSTVEFGESLGQFQLLAPSVGKT